MLDHALRPLLASLGALNVPSAVFVIDAQFGPDGPTSAVLERLECALLEAVRLSGPLALALSPST
jgi:NAD(P)H-dependent FMN reductase